MWSRSRNSKINNVLEFRISDKLKINSASVEDIYSRLKGIGPKTAQAIVDYRNQYGPFESPEDLLAVKGIGPATIRDIEQQIAYSLKAMKDIQQLKNQFLCTLTLKYIDVRF